MSALSTPLDVVDSRSRCKELRFINKLTEIFRIFPISSHLTAIEVDLLKATLALLRELIAEKTTPEEASGQAHLKHAACVCFAKVYLAERFVKNVCETRKQDRRSPAEKFNDVIPKDYKVESEAHPVKLL